MDYALRICSESPEEDEWCENGSHAEGCVRAQRPLTPCTSGEMLENGSA